MTSSTLLLSAAGSAVTALLYLYVGQVLRRRQVSADAKLAHGMFILWWEAIGWLGILTGAVLIDYTLQGAMPSWLYQTYIVFVLMVLFVALWGLQFYLVYLYTGSKRSFIPLGIFYTLLFLATVALVEWTWAQPFRVTDNGWQLVQDPQVQLGPVAGLLFSLVVVGPQVFAAIAYARLYRKTSDRTQRYRIALIASAIIVWFGSSIAGTAAGVTTSVYWQLFSRVVSIAGALIILIAYLPPRWIRDRFQVRSIRDEDHAAAA
jgi:hypothetical protein